MKRPELRPYQAEAGAKVNAAIAAGYRRVLMVAPTGSGKTVIAAAMIDQAAAAGREVLVVAHRREIRHRGRHHSGRRRAPARIAGAGRLDPDTARSGYPGLEMEMPPADRLVIDEAHHARADTYCRNNSDQKREFYQQLLGVARDRGYAAGYAYHQFREQFPGVKPPWSWRSLPPLDPNQQVLAWVRARARDFARSHQDD